MSEKGTDEIDLTELLVKLKNIFLRNKITIALLTIVGLLLGLLYYNLKPAVYQSEIVVRATVLNESLLKVINENLTQLIKENNYKGLAQKLNLSTKVAEYIQSVEIEPTDENADKKLEYAFYVIKVESFSNDHWSELEEGMLHYLSHNTYVKKRIDLKSEQYAGFIAKLDEEINQIDSLKRGLYQSENFNKDNVVLMNPGEVYTALLELIKQKQQLEEELEFNQAVEIVEDFDAYQRPVSPRPVFSVAVGGLIGFLISLFIAFGREFNSYLKQYERTHS
ncbi:Wzz/FepE/Etk N-terminal domain-containing protein [Fulvivirga ulvae]|uniref:GNVR domain-containing protein n=1 Tax=Fulvivirga ulvae TaxID=2904245 RepID=UPI001F475C4E|nr:GNVR domain-containing protein [Fulvivirga ulvae]UII34305.1 Wzz/FepE/Etk N-terminal domain-containing protein [Fulvivirga ulvae]